MDFESMTNLAQTLATTFVLVQVCMVVLWIIGTVRRDVSIVDPFWGTGFILLSWAAVLRSNPANPRLLLLTSLTTVWGVRLSLYLILRNWGHSEDRRYAEMRKYHGQRFWWISFVTVFLLQGCILWFVSLPLQIASVRRLASALGFWDALGVIVWGIGFLFESIGDWQLARFKSDPANAGQVMDRGLWRYTRHPNYFGDFCVWWGLYVIAAIGGAGMTFLSPVLMSVLLMKVSGVTLLESTIIDRRPDYADYCQRTNAFFPGPNR